MVWLRFVLMAFLVSGIQCLSVNAPVVRINNKISFQDGKRYYRYLNIIEGKNGATYLYTGAQNFLYRHSALDIGISKNVEKVEIVANDVQLQNCQSKGYKESYLCSNHIRSVMIFGENITVCGSGAIRPSITYLATNTLNILSQVETQLTWLECSSTPDLRDYVLYVPEGNPEGISATYSATYFMTTGGVKQPIIYRPPLKSSASQDKPPTINPSNIETWFKNPTTFVGSFDIGVYVYYFFREEAVEYFGLKTQILSRVARLCKKDRGIAGSISGLDEFSTFQKISLNCTIPGERSVFLEQIVDVIYLDNIFYGLFSADANSVKFSGICSFTLNSIEQALDTNNFLEQIDYKHLWQAPAADTIPKPRPGLCTDDVNQVANIDRVWSRNHPLLHGFVDANPNQPIFTFDEVQFDQMVQIKENDVLYFYLSTNKGEIYKLVKLTDSFELLAIWKPFVADTRIWSMKTWNSWLYLGTDDEVIQLNVAGQCPGYTLCSDCVRDLHCGWRGESCVDRGTSNVQDISGCPCNVVHNATVRVWGDALHLPILSACRFKPPVQWYYNDVSLTPDSQVTVTKDWGLVLLNVTRDVEGRYKSMDSDGLIVTRYDFKYRNGCPTADYECHWKEEFRKWCDSFVTYKQNYNHWACLKQECAQGTCNQDTCSRPESIYYQPGI